MSAQAKNVGWLAGLSLGALLLLFPVGYMGAFYGLVERGLPYSWHALEPTAEYRIAGEAAEKFFWPANQIDRRIRTEFWSDGWP